ncbi:glycosyltransferase family 2 protein [Halomonas sp. RA08-2]|uniref:glycosyltransferase family 2 protein n=1 Tax=Halomonas sp. RA08-2 TaxID=3440842 RepID=UPI003EEC858C
MFAPVLITVYNRAEHLSQCINSLLRCPEAPKTVVYIASDAAYRNEDEASIKQVRDYIATIKGFKDVVLFARETNLGSQENYMKARDYVFDRHPALITMEDDVVVGKGFMKFINDGLDKYFDNDKVLAICGYIMPGGDGIEEEPYFLNEQTPYGSGIWKHKEGLVDTFLSPNLADAFLKDWKLFNSVENQTPANIRALPIIAKGDLVANDIQSLLGMNRYNLFALFPPKTLTKSVGHDGTGMHSGVNHELQNQQVYDGFLAIPDNLEIKLSKRVNQGIVNSQKSFLVTLVNRSIFIGYKFIPGFYSLFKPARKMFKSAKKSLSS